MRYSILLDSSLLMEGQPSAAGFICLYAGGKAERAVFRFDACTAELHFASEATRNIHLALPFIMDVYTQSCGVGISPDAKLLFVPSWEKGLFCLSGEDGRLLWLYQCRGIQGIYCSEGCVICQVEGDGLHRVSLDGTLLQRLPFTSAEHCYMLQDGTILIGPKRNQFHLLQPSDFSLLKKIPAKLVTGTEDDPYLQFQATGTSAYITLQCWHNDQKIIRHISPEAKERSTPMSKYVARAKELRAIVDPHYNCGQAVILPFAEELGIPHDLVMRFAANFGGGMKCGALCGSVAGGVTALALYGLSTPDDTAEYYARVREKHTESLDCKPLLTRNAELGNEKKPFCDGLVYECVEIVEDMLRKAGKIE